MVVVHGGHGGSRHGLNPVGGPISVWAGEKAVLPNAAGHANPGSLPHRRGAIRGLIVMPALVNVLPLTAYLIEALGPWQRSVRHLWTLGIGWAAAFWWWFRDHPSDHQV